MSTEGARQHSLLNLSGKRTEKEYTDFFVLLYILICIVTPEQLNLPAVLFL